MSVTAAIVVFGLLLVEVFLVVWLVFAGVRRWAPPSIARRFQRFTSNRLLWRSVAVLMLVHATWVFVGLER